MRVARHGLNMPRALIAGAGVAGLAAALALAEAGWESTLFERAPELEEFGAGLQLSPNCTRVLASLGAAVVHASVRLTGRSCRARRGL